VQSRTCTVAASQPWLFFLPDSAATKRGRIPWNAALACAVSVIWQFCKLFYNHLLPLVDMPVTLIVEVGSYGNCYYLGSLRQLGLFTIGLASIDCVCQKHDHMQEILHNVSGKASVNEISRMSW
jgi:hypothetical protein